MKANSRNNHILSGIIAKYFTMPRRKAATLAQTITAPTIISATGATMPYSEVNLRRMVRIHKLVIFVNESGLVGVYDTKMYNADKARKKRDNVANSVRGIMRKRQQEKEREKMFHDAQTFGGKKHQGLARSLNNEGLYVTSRYRSNEASTRHVAYETRGAITLSRMYAKMHTQRNITES